MVVTSSSEPEDEYAVAQHACATAAHCLHVLLELPAGGRATAQTQQWHISQECRFKAREHAWGIGSGAEVGGGARRQSPPILLKGVVCSRALAGRPCLCCCICRLAAQVPLHQRPQRAHQALQGLRSMAMSEEPDLCCIGWEACGVVRSRPEVSCHVRHM